VVQGASTLSAGEDFSFITMINNIDKLQERRRLGLMIFASLNTFFLVGALLGWGPMQLLLEQNGNFASKCSVEEQESGIICADQTKALVNLQFYTLMSQITSPVLGELVDRFGSTFLCYCMTCLNWLGLIFLIVAAKYVIDPLVYAAFQFLAFSTWMGGLLTVQTGLVFAGRTRSRVIYMLNALFDAGSITYLGLWAIGENSNLSLAQIIGGYFAFSVLIFGGSCYFWAVAKPVQSEEGVKIAEKDPTVPSDPNNSEEGKDDVGDSTVEESEGMTGPADLEARETTPVGDDNTDMCVDQEHLIPPTTAMNGAYEVVSSRTPFKQLTSLPFFLVGTFFVIHMASNQWVLTTTRDFLGYLGDNEVNNKYLTIFTLIMPASVAALPFTDATIHRFGFHGGFQAINILALGYSLIRLLSDNLNIQIIGFVLFAFYQSFLYGVVFSYIPTLLAQNVVGKAMGILYAVGGLSSLLNIPLSTLAIRKRDFFIPNLMYTILLLPCFAAALGLGHFMKMERAALQGKKEDALRQSLGGVLLHRHDSDERQQV
jgi:hypothetical protein